MSTVGYHLFEALTSAHAAARLGDIANALIQTDAPDSVVEPIARNAWWHDGAAAGHAFRAAELAYDLGAREASR